MSRRFTDSHSELLYNVKTHTTPFEMVVQCKKRNVGLKGLTVQYRESTNTYGIPVKIPLEGKIIFKARCQGCNKVLTINAHSIEKEKSLRKRQKLVDFPVAILLIGLLFYSQERFYILIGVILSIYTLISLVDIEQQKMIYIFNPLIPSKIFHPFKMRNMNTGILAPSIFKSKNFRNWILRVDPSRIIYL